ncbi:hypothetical protein M1145_00010 [Patescibacteria group bacterium]|nr:hypothetical protein [Patescibacteria group bacterium]
MTIDRIELVKIYIQNEIKKNEFKKNELESILEKIQNPNNKDNPNNIDMLFYTHELKVGIIPGYETWEEISINQSFLNDCAISNNIFENENQSLKVLKTKDCFNNWKPNRETLWYKDLEFPVNNKSEWKDKFTIILRPAVQSEEDQGALYYIEDGSGKSICFLRRMIKDKDNTTTIKGYLGIEPDIKSIFMQEKFSELFPSKI